MSGKYAEISDQITGEVRSVIQQIDPVEIDRLVQEILLAEKVFIYAVGRVFLSLQCFGKRLGHLGIDCQVVGSITEKPISEKDLLIIASGSGESKLPCEIARIAKRKGARLGLITANPTSTIQSMSDFAVQLSCPTKISDNSGVSSIQPMSSLFDQSLHILGDVVAILIQEEKGLKTGDLWQYHANLE